MSDQLAPPHDLAAEAAVLSAVLLDPRRLEEVRWLRPEEFFSEAHRQIWSAVLFLRAAGRSIDNVTVGSHLKDLGRIDQVGGLSYLTEVLLATPAIAHVEDHAKIVSNKAKLRALADNMRGIMGRCYVDPDLSKIVADAASIVTDAAATVTARVTMLSAAEVFAPMPQIPWLVQGLRLCPGRPSLLAGYGFSGKTLCAQSLAVSVAAGRDVWGAFRVQRPGPVIHLNHDQGLHATRLRYQRIARAMGVAFEELTGRLHLAQYPRLYLDSANAEAEYTAIARGAALVIIDALTGAISETEENSPAMGRLLYQLAAASDATGCVFIVIHHASKPPPQRAPGQKTSARHAIRGSSAIYNACDDVFILEAVGKGQPVRVAHDKSPAVDGSTLDDFAVEFDDVANGDDSRWGLRVTYIGADELAEREERDRPRPEDGAMFAQLCERIVEMVKLYPDITGSEIKERMGKVSKNRIYTGLRSLERSGRLVKVIGPKKSEQWRAI